MELPEEEDEDYSFDVDGQEHLELIDTSWIDETTPKDEVDLVAAFTSRVRSYTRKRTSEEMEYGRAYVNAPGGRWITDDDSDRKWRLAALQGCPKALRKKVAEKSYIDLDMVGAAPCLLMSVAREYGLENHGTRKHICDTSGCTMEDAKLNINMVLHGVPRRFAESEFISALREESRSIAECIWEDQKWSSVRDRCTKARPKFQLLSLVWQTMEHEALMCVWKLLKNDHRIAFIFDSMLVPRDLVGDHDALVRKFAEVQRDHSELCPELRWAVKAW
ncbi:hypothetical protein T492DRAFT_1042152 [Pavlovales sp. CCMP2436]|nr:hypothetical protein T492DRAFT_1042152 [Pavlovales sp. CCMP2436]